MKRSSQFRAVEGTPGVGILFSRVLVLTRDIDGPVDPVCQILLRGCTEERNKTKQTVDNQLAERARIGLASLFRGLLREVVGVATYKARTVSHTQ